MADAPHPAAAAGFGAVFTLLGAIAGYASHAWDTSIAHGEKADAALVQHVQAFSGALRDAIPTLTGKNSDNQTIEITLISLFGLADGTRLEDIRLQEKKAVIVLGGAIPRPAVQQVMLSVYRGDREAQQILDTVAPNALLALRNGTDPGQSTNSKSLKAVDAEPQTTLVPNVDIARVAPTTNVGWLYLGRGAYDKTYSRIPAITFGTTITPATLPDPFPKDGMLVTAVTNVNFRTAAPTTELRLAPITGVVKKGQQLRVLDIRTYKFNDETAAVWAHAQIL